MKKLALALVFPASVMAAPLDVPYQDSGEYFCAPKHITQGQCQEGDALYIGWAGALRFCDLDEPITQLGDGRVICYFTGEQRLMRFDRKHGN